MKRQWFCLCEICENALFLVNGLDKKSISRKLTSSNHKWAGCEVLMRRCWKMHVREMRKVLFFYEDFNVESIADSDSENSNTSDSDCNYNQQTAIAAFMNGLVKELNWSKCSSKKVSISRPENSPPQWRHLSIIYTSNVSNSTNTAASKATWVGTTYLFMLSTVSAVKTNVSMRYRSTYFGHT